MASLGNLLAASDYISRRRMRGLTYRQIMRQIDPSFKGDVTPRRCLIRFAEIEAERVADDLGQAYSKANNAA